MISNDNIQIVVRLLVAVLAGAMIGYERSFSGRPAGFRTHALVCTASSLLMLVTVYEAHWVKLAVDSIRLDPTRMAQGIMTGIGFLGAGVIIKEGLSVRGLTTAASIWMTAAIGILAGIGFYFPLAVSVFLAVGILSLFHWIEAHMPVRTYYYFDVRFERETNMTEQALREMLTRHGFSIANFSYRLDSEGQILRHSMVLRTVDNTSASRLAQTLVTTESVREFRLSPTGN